MTEGEPHEPDGAEPSGAGANLVKILAFLQNTYVRDPDQLRRILDGRDEDFRRQMIARLLFAGCVSGRRLKAAFGELINRIVWEEASREIGGQPNAAPPADVDHMVAVIEELKPEIVLTFGRIATNGALKALTRLEGRHSFVVMSAPHPASRGDALSSALGMMAQELRGRVG